MRRYPKWGGSEDGSASARENRPLARRFTYRYALALTLLSLLALWTLWEIRGSLIEIDEANRELSAVMDQQQRVDQIVRNATDMVAAVNTDNEPAPGDETLFREQLRELEATQRALVQGSGERDLPGDPSGDLRELYFGSEAQLDQEIDSFVTLAHTLPQFLRLESPPDPRNDIVAQLQEAIAPGEGPVALGLERAGELYSDKVSNAVARQQEANQFLFLVYVIAVLVVVFVLLRPMANSIQIETTNLRDAERSHRENNERQTFHTQLNQALEGAEDEEEVLQAVARAMSDIERNKPGELLLLDDSGAHLRQVQVSPDAGAPNCPVDSPNACAAIRRGQTIAYETSRALNVCPKLTQHEGGACSAVCAPVMFLGRSIGVLHTTGTDMVPPDPTHVERLNVLARETGSRLGTMRAAAQTQLQASTDGLTGLPNRRSLEQAASDLITAGRPFAIAMADLDHFKDLNDTYGHESGDRALRLFARTIRQNLRPDDTAARYGGEEFMLLLPNTSVAEAKRALDRLRVTLAGEIAASGNAPFTASWGLTTSEMGSSFDEMVVAADEALYKAKRAGRNRVMVDDNIEQEDDGRRAIIIESFEEPPACAVCGSPNPAGSRYCLECGHLQQSPIEPS
jgi:diguanylate cyclase (GGDEF)-like protein